MVPSSAAELERWESFPIFKTLTDSLHLSCKDDDIGEVEDIQPGDAGKHGIVKILKAQLQTRNESKQLARGEKPMSSTL